MQGVVLTVLILVGDFLNTVDLQTEIVSRKHSLLIQIKHQIWLNFASHVISWEMSFLLTRHDVEPNIGPFFLETTLQQDLPSYARSFGVLRCGQECVDCTQFFVR